MFEYKSLYLAVILMVSVGCGKAQSSSGMDSGSGDIDVDADGDSDIDGDSDSDTDTENVCDNGNGGDTAGDCFELDSDEMQSAIVIQRSPFDKSVDLSFCDASVDVSCNMNLPDQYPFTFVVYGQSGHEAVEQALFDTGMFDGGLPAVDYSSQRLVGYGGTACCACGVWFDDSWTKMYQLTDGGVHVVHKPVYFVEGSSADQGSSVDYSGVVVIDITTMPTVCLDKADFLLLNEM